jgi:hypothetical protein
MTKKLSLSEQFEQAAKIVGGKMWQTAKSARIYLQQQGASVWFDFSNSTHDSIGFPNLHVEMKDCTNVDDVMVLFGKIYENSLPESLALHVFCDTMNTAKAEKALLKGRTNTPEQNKEEIERILNVNV